ncbi:MAG: hypothetical protein JKY48_11605 [Flavobacteriales bacterium]|nr:hypothetical protein [Flavobacteriales bacterium]
MKNFFILLGVYISIVPLVIAILKIKKLNRAFILLTLMIACETGVSIYSRGQQINNINNLPSLHFLTFFEFLLGGSFFYLSIQSQSLKRWILFLMVSFLSYTIINSFYIQRIEVYNQIARTLEAYLFVLFSFFFFYELLKQEGVIRLSQSPEFWAVTAFFTYFGTTQFVHLFPNYIMDHHYRFYLILGHLNRLMVIIYYSIFTIALWKKK